MHACIIVIINFIITFHAVLVHKKWSTEVDIQTQSINARYENTYILIYELMAFLLGQKPQFVAHEQLKLSLEPTGYMHAHLVLSMV